MVLNVNNNYYYYCRAFPNVRNIFTDRYKQIEDLGNNIRFNLLV